MTPSARLQAAIELLDEIIVAARDDGASADNIIKKFFKARRYAGSKDRRAVRELVYQAIRRFGDRPADGRSAMIGLLDDHPELSAQFDGSTYGPAELAKDEAGASGGAIPQWLREKFAAPIDEQEGQALLGRAALDIRVNPARSSGEALRNDWPDLEELPLENAFRLPAGTQVEKTVQHDSGQIEVQDLGSQAIVAACLSHSPGLLLDLCAGAGGKTLGLAAGLPETARIIAADKDKRRLGRIVPRLERSATGNVETLLLDPGKEEQALASLAGQCDLVLVDAPCSGTGTWRRNPELRWRMTPDRLERTVKLQGRLFELGSQMVARGGRLIYAVCSLLDEEGAAQTRQFLGKHPDWRHIEVDLPLGRPYRKGILLSPYQDGTDGFYFTCLEKL